MDKKSQSEWSPSNEDVERVARRMCLGAGLLPDTEAYDTTNLPVSPVGRPSMGLMPLSHPAWTFFRVEAYWAVVELHERPIGWKPEQDVIFTDDEPEDSGDTVPGTVDLSGLTTVVTALSRDEQWLRNSGLK